LQYSYCTTRNIARADFAVTIVVAAMVHAVTMIMFVHVLMGTKEWIVLNVSSFSFP
jgi:hypothetical protein